MCNNSFALIRRLVADDWKTNDCNYVTKNDFKECNGWTWPREQKWTPTYIEFWRDGISSKKWKHLSKVKQTKKKVKLTDLSGEVFVPRLTSIHSMNLLIRQKRRGTRRKRRSINQDGKKMNNKKEVQRVESLCGSTDRFLNCWPDFSAVNLLFNPESTLETAANQLSLIFHRNNNKAKHTIATSSHLSMNWRMQNVGPLTRSNDYYLRWRWRWTAIAAVSNSSLRAAFSLVLSAVT